MNRALRLVVALLASCTLAALASAGELVTLTGKSLKGDVVGVDAQTVSFKEAGSGTIAKIPVKEVGEINLGSKLPIINAAVKRNEIELVDGSVLVAPAVVIKGKKVEPTFIPQPPGVTAPTVDLPMTNLFWLMRNAEDPKAKVEWKKLLTERGKRDLFVTIDEKGNLSPLAGTFLEGDDKGVGIQFQDAVSDEKRRLLQARATGGFVFNQPPRDTIPQTVCKVRDVFGNVLIAQAVAVSDSGIKVTTVSGATFEYPGSTGIAKLDFAEGNVKYLVELDPVVAGPDEIPGEPRLTYLKNRTQDGARLRLDGIEYQKGLLIFPDTALTYNLGGDYREFKAMVGVDDRIPVANSNVRLTIEGDGRKLFSENISRKDKPRTVTLDVKEIKQLKISVERESLYLGNQVNLADVRVQK